MLPIKLVTSSAYAIIIAVITTYMSWIDDTSEQRTRPSDNLITKRIIMWSEMQANPNAWHDRRWRRCSEDSRGEQSNSDSLGKQSVPCTGYLNYIKFSLSFGQRTQYSAHTYLKYGKSDPLFRDIYPWNDDCRDIPHMYIYTYNYYKIYPQHQEPSQNYLSQGCGLDKIDTVTLAYRQVKKHGWVCISKSLTCFSIPPRAGLIAGII